MRNLDQYLDAYGQSHRNPLNQKIHFVCVPLIFFATLGLAWCLPLGAWLGLPEGLAFWVNGATVGSLPALAFYLWLGLRPTLVAVSWFVLSVLGILAILAVGLPLLWTSLAIWVGAWAVQFYGHQVEGAKPSFSEDILFLLIGPLFVVEELIGGLGSEAASDR